jgi:hypothetical protein
MKSSYKITMTRMFRSSSVWKQVDIKSWIYIRNFLSVNQRKLSSVVFPNDLNRNLKIKVVAFELRLVIDPVNGARSLSGEAPDIRQKTTSLPLLAKAGTVASPAKVAEPSKLDVPLPPMARYGQKIAMKLANSLAGKVNQFGPTGLEAAMMGTASRWLIAEGMGDLLDYIFNRSVKLAMIGSAVEYPQSIIEQLSSQLSNTKLSYVRSSIDRESYPNAIVPFSTVYKHMNTSFDEMEAKLNVSRSSILLVSADDMSLSLGKERGYHTCRFRGENDLYGQVSTEFVARNALEIKDSITDLIGISLRESVLTSSSKF